MRPPAKATEASAESRVQFTNLLALHSLGSASGTQCDRPSIFWRGYDLFDQAKVDFVTDSPEAQRIGIWLDTASKGAAIKGMNSEPACRKTRKGLRWST